MLKIQEIREIIKLIDKSSITEFEYEAESSKITLKKNAANDAIFVQPTQPNMIPSQPEQNTMNQTTDINTTKPVEQSGSVEKQISNTTNENVHTIESPMVGTFYSAPSPDADNFVSVGSKITKDTIVCIIEAMKLFNEIEAEVNGEIVDILVENGQLVEYGQPLFLVKAE